MDNKYALKRFGQNFLKDEIILQKIAFSIDLKDKKIIEIGPGKGSLTKLILPNVRELVAFEIDYKLVDFLKDEIQNPKFILINQNFLETDLSTYKNYSIIANIPYNITSQILFKIFENYQNFEDIVLMVQKEVAERITAKSGTTNYGKLSISSQNFFNIKKLFDVPPKAFYPQPKVTSSVIHLSTKNIDEIINDSEFLFFVKNCFIMRRKKLINNLKHQENFDKIKITEFYEQHNFDENIRPQELTLKQYQVLFLLLKKK